MSTASNYSDPATAITIDYIVVSPDVARDNAAIFCGKDTYLLSGDGGGQNLNNILRALTIAKCAGVPVMITTTGYEKDGYQYIQSVKL
ncbi:hypothetical protein BOSP111201_03160 [Bordetella sputigena]|uniref:hypothetical protein n=1 Tax=Bordetella sputigena TaxID=1416810 RepID=UPI0039EF307C